MRRRKSGGVQRTSGIRTGTQTLLLLITSVVLAIVAVLAVQTANQNASRAEAFAQHVTQSYANDSAGQELLAKVDATIASGGGAAQLQAVLGPGCIVGESSIETVLVESVPNDPASVSGELELDNGGIASSGLNTADVETKPALSIKLSYAKDGYTVLEWNHMRAS